MVGILRDEKIGEIGSLYVRIIVRNIDGIMMKAYSIVSLALILEQRGEFIIK